MEAFNQGGSRISVETRRDGTSVASELFAQYPSRLHLTSLPSHEDEEEPSPSKALTCYVLGYGGGLISGDVIELNIAVKENAKLIVTSQSTSKAFKAVSGRNATFVKTRAKVCKGGLLFLVPQPMQCFGNSVLTQDTQIVMEGGIESGKEEDDPSLLLVDWYTGGRENLDGGLWQLDTFHTTTTVSFSHHNLFPKEEDVDDKSDENSKASCELVFRDATRLSGGKILRRHMRDYNIVCMVVLIGPKVKEVASTFMKQYSSRHTYDEDEAQSFGKNPSKNMDYNKGEGLNQTGEGLLVSCGTFQTGKKNRYQEGVVVRIAAATLEIAANFLSKHIGTLDGQLDADPFMEILVSRQGASGTMKKGVVEEQPLTGIREASFDLISKSYVMNSTNENGIYSSPFNADGLQSLTCSRSKAVKHVHPLTMFQLIDSCVPSGGFAHSNTLEAAHQLHLLDTSKASWTDSLYSHIWDVLLNTATSTVPFLIASCHLFRTRYHSSSDNLAESLNASPLPKDNAIIEQWVELDNFLRSTTTSHVANRSSTTQGSGMLRAFSIAFPHISPVVKALKRTTLKVHSSLADCTGHNATCFGAVCGLLGVDEETCCTMFLYTTARDMVNSAVRMNLIGPLEGGRLTHGLCLAVEKLVTEELLNRFEREETEESNCDSETEENSQHIGGPEVLDVAFAHQVCPLIEILANAHDRLYTRLFNS